MKKGMIITIISVSVAVALGIGAAIGIPAIIQRNKEADYAKAVSVLESKSYNEAKQLFTELGDFEDSKERIEYCDNALAYEDAMTDYKAGRYHEAVEKFGAINSFEDASDMVRKCLDNISLEDARAYMEKGEYSKAISSLELIFDTSIGNITELKNLCNNMIDYNDAIKTFDKGKLYEAYNKFKELGSFKKSKQYMSKCRVKTPSNGTITRRSGRSTCALTVNPANRTQHTYIKIYKAGSGKKPAGTIFIRKGRQASISLPSGKYIMKVAYGLKWFGTKDMFGDEGSYQVLISGYKKNGSAKKAFYLQYGRRYTLTLRTKKVTGQRVTSQSENRHSF